MVRITLAPPLEITPRLLPGVRVGGAWVALDYESWEWFIDLPDGTEVTERDFHPGTRIHGETASGYVRRAIGDFLGFLAAFAAGVEDQRRTGEPDEAADLFPDALADWAAENVDNLGILVCEIEGS